MSRLPAALFVVDTTREHIAVAEAIKLNIPIFAMVDTNCDPRVIDYIIPSNDDASKSIDKIMTAVAEAVKEGLSERKAGKESAEKAKAEKQAPVETKETEEAAPEKEAAVKLQKQNRRLLKKKQPQLKKRQHLQKKHLQKKHLQKRL